MAASSSKKTQSDLIELVKAAGWKEDQKSSREWRWWHPSYPGIYYKLRDGADLVRLRTAGVAKSEVQASPR